jgi:hypothetical protein
MVKAFIWLLMVGTLKKQSSTLKGKKTVWVFSLRKRRTIFEDSVGENCILKSSTFKCLLLFLLCYIFHNSLPAEFHMAKRNREIQSIGRNAIVPLQNNLGMYFLMVTKNTTITYAKVLL